MGILQIMAGCIVLLAWISNAPFAAADWSGPADVIMGRTGSGKGEVGFAKDAAAPQPAAIESVLPDGSMVIVDPVNRKKMLFTRSGTFTREEPLSPADKSAPSPRSATSAKQVKCEKGIVLIALAFPDRGVVLEGDREYVRFMRDDRGAVYAIGWEQVSRFSEGGSKSAELFLPKPQEELLPDMERKRLGKLAVYVEYGEPYIAPNGDVYVLKLSEADFTVLRWTWSGGAERAGAGGK